MCHRKPERARDTSVASVTRAKVFAVLHENTEKTSADAHYGLLIFFQLKVGEE